MGGERERERGEDESREMGVGRLYWVRMGMYVIYVCTDGIRHADLNCNPFYFFPSPFSPPYFYFSQFLGW